MKVSDVRGMKVVYVAGPFRGDNHWVIEGNIRRAEELALEVWRMGAAAICPHANTRYYQGALPDSVWLDGDLAILYKCDAVLLTPDWFQSEGAKAEEAYAKALNIPVFDTLDHLKAWLYAQDASPPPKIRPKPRGVRSSRPSPGHAPSP